MFDACSHRFRKRSMIRVRNVPDDLHRRLKARAALADMSLSDFLLAEFRDVAERPSVEEPRRVWRAAARQRPPCPPAEAVRSERDRA